MEIPVVDRGDLDVELCIVFTEHRIEYLPHLYEVARRSDMFILEEPSTDVFRKVLRGELRPEDYAEQVYTEFPQYIQHQLEILYKLQREGVIIEACEPYLEKLLQIYRHIEQQNQEGLRRLLQTDNIAHYVHTVENLASSALLDYYDAVLSGDFERVVDSVIKFSRADALRILLRDLCRAYAILDLLRRYENERVRKVVVETGTIHTFLPITLRKLVRYQVYCINLKLRIYHELGLKPLPHPGDMLTRSFIHGLPLRRDLRRLYAARAVVYNMLITKTELKPTEHAKYPHIVQEYRVLELVNKLGYRECEKVYRRYYEKVLAGKRE